MRIHSLWIAGFWITILLFHPGPAHSNDCDALRQSVQKERSLIKKQQLLDEAIQTCPNHAQLQYDKAFAQERLRRYDEALTYYLRATELDENFAKAYFGLADIFVVLGNLEPAIWAYQSGLALEPDNQRAAASLELARIKYRSEMGERITSEEFVRVMRESRDQSTTEGAMDGPIVRMQILFEIGSAGLTASAIEQLETVGTALSHASLADQRFEIAGHTDSTGSPEVNLPLSKLRAERVKQHLIDRYSIAADRLTVAYYGDTRPAVPNDSTRNRAINRRVEFRKIR
ncbi:OmpA family protein [Pelovirga terrestris]|uniref:OmpA family protein n=1 Tax=Pelovirga terrestris TaxID=2771352 RepID=UPI001CD16233|nr:OmpA family protein [Pelovirga terrestris]